MCVCHQIGQPAHMETKHMYVYTHTHTHSGQKRQIPGHTFLSLALSFIDPFSLAFSTHLSLHPFSVGTAAPTGVRADDLCLSRCLCLAPVHIFLSSSVKLNSAVATYQRYCDFGQTCNSRQPPTRSLRPPSSHVPSSS